LPTSVTDETAWLIGGGNRIGLGKVARPEDAWELLPYVETEYGDDVIRTITKIADPSIIPALEEAVRL